MREGTAAPQTESFRGYPVRITIFEGPLDLLLYLIRRQEMDIHEVPLAEITDQYLAYLQAMAEVNIELAGEFLVMASTLLLIKSRSLLPATTAEGEEEAAEETPTTEAEIRRRLEEYRLYKEAARALDESRKMRQRIFLRPLRETEDVGGGYVPLEKVSVFDMITAVKEMLERARPERPARLARVTVTVGGRIQEIVFRLNAEHPAPVSFHDVVDDPGSRLHIIVTFLAVLELIRQRRVNVTVDAESRAILIRAADKLQQ